MLQSVERKSHKIPYFPQAMTNELAEDIGWQIGDGCIIKRGYVKLAGDPVEEKLFYDNVVIPTKNRLFGMTTNARILTDGSYGLVIGSSELVRFYTQVIGLPFAPKTSIQIPQSILDSDISVIKSCVRGVFDTDGSLTFRRRKRQYNHYPSIQIESISPELIKQLSEILNSVGLSCYTQFNMHRKPTSYGYVRTANRLFVDGKSKLEKWMSVIGFKSPKHLTKYMVWEQFGQCPAYTRLADRIAILEGKADIDSFYKDET